jgi:ATP-dependent Clp protease adaptor protein ClpS
MARASSAQPETTSDPKTRTIPPYHVIVENDDNHSMPFVVGVLRKVFSFAHARAVELMLLAHHNGEVIVWTGPQEVAELKIDQIRTNREKHWQTGEEIGPLRCRIEPAV